MFRVALTRWTVGIPSYCPLAGIKCFAWICYERRTKMLPSPRGDKMFREQTGVKVHISGLPSPRGDKMVRNWKPLWTIWRNSYRPLTGIKCFFDVTAWEKTGELPSPRGDHSFLWKSPPFPIIITRVLAKATNFNPASVALLARAPVRRPSPAPVFGSAGQRLRTPPPHRAARRRRSASSSFSATLSGSSSSSGRLRASSGS